MIGEEAQEIFATFTWTTAEDSAKVKTILKKLRNIANTARMYRLRGTDSTNYARL